MTNRRCVICLLEYYKRHDRVPDSTEYDVFRGTPLHGNYVVNGSSYCAQHAMPLLLIDIPNTHDHIIHQRRLPLRLLHNVLRKRGKKHEGEPGS